MAIQVLIPFLLLPFFAWPQLSNSSEPRIKAFQTDLCTFYPEGTRERPNLWAHCCIKHDLAYWVAGNREDLDRADFALKVCVTEVSTPFNGHLMYRGVRAGHYSPFKGKYRWSWAWPKSRKKFQTLTEDEKNYILENIFILAPNINPQLLDEFIDFRF